MKYELVYTRRAVKDIGKLDPKTKSRIGDTLLRYKEDPIAYDSNTIRTQICLRSKTRL